MAKTSHLVVRVTPELKDACRHAAGKSGVDLSDWTRAVLSKAVQHGLWADSDSKNTREGSAAERR